MHWGKQRNEHLLVALAKATSVMALKKAKALWPEEQLPLPSILWGTSRLFAHFPQTPNTWASEGRQGGLSHPLDCEIFSWKGCCRSFEWVKWNFKTFSPHPENFFLNPLVPPPRKKSFRSPCSKRNFFLKVPCSVYCWNTGNRAKYKTFHSSLLYKHVHQAHAFPVQIEHHMLCSANLGQLLPKGSCWTVRFLPLGKSKKQLQTLNMSQSGWICSPPQCFHSSAETTRRGTTTCQIFLPRAKLAFTSFLLEKFRCTLPKSRQLPPLLNTCKAYADFENTAPQIA